ncbi:NADPH:quinone reductase [Nocardioides terrae]|uniref:NADPH:quinone reductase n=1 Tax=Nocardioides terrae TaxID=574651 RepID=A0A1I1G924_9ACTN|nr:NADP-dependent oxidoreductase [Nocardioides terrae]SFC05650.1 NADPH:quinone reductase [Nocardioides terrae]
MATMVVAREFGGPEVLDLVEADVPSPGPEEVRIVVRAAGVNPADAKLRQGLFGRPPLPLRLGSEVAGVVAEVGSGVDHLRPGDEVVAYRVSGGYATELVTKAANAFRKPADLPFEEAAGLLLAGVTATQALEVAAAGKGDTLLVHGASGGVGQLLVQLARLRGVRVIGTGSARSADVLHELGAEPVEYGDGLAARVRALAPDGVTCAIDLAGTDEALAVSLELVDDRDRIVTAAPGEAAVEAGIRAIGGGPGADPGTAIRNAARADLVRLAGEGSIRVRVARTFPLAEAADAQRLVAEGHSAGKVVLVP